MKKVNVSVKVVVKPLSSTLIRVNQVGKYTRYFVLKKS